MRMVYFEQEDILHLMVASGSEAQSIELSPDVTVEMDTDGQTLGVEIVNASQYVPELLAQLLAEISTLDPDEVLEYLLHEGPDDATSDDELLAEALEMLQTYKHDKSGWKSLEDFEAELSRE